MPVIEPGSILEDIAAWILDATGAPASWPGGATPTVILRNPKTRATVLDPAGAVTLSNGEGTGDDPVDDPNVVVVLDDAVADLLSGRYRLDVTVTVDGRALVRSWPFTIR